MLADPITITQDFRRVCEVLLPLRKALALCIFPQSTYGQMHTGYLVNGSLFHPWAPCFFIRQNSFDIHLMPEHLALPASF